MLLWKLKLAKLFVRADILTGIEKEHRSSVLTKTFMKKIKKKNEKTFISYVGRISAKSAFSFLWLTLNGIARDLHCRYRYFNCRSLRKLYFVSIKARMFRDIF